MDMKEGLLVPSDDGQGQLSAMQISHQNNCPNDLGFNKGMVINRPQKDTARVQHLLLSG